MADDILDKLSGAENLPTLPAVALQVLQLIHENDVPVKKIAAVIEKDPALSAKILRTVNSVLFGYKQKIAALPQAMVVLGLRSVKILALSFSLIEKFEDSGQPDFDQTLFWRRSLTTAVSSRMLSEKYRAELCDEAFVSGLLSDLGVLAAVHYAADDYQPVLAEYAEHTRPLQEIERQRLGVTHAQIGASLLGRWQLPDVIVHAIAHHHDCEVPRFEKQHELTHLVWSAARLADLFCTDVPATKLDATLKDISAALEGMPGIDGQSVSVAEIQCLLDNVDQRIQETASGIELEIGQTVSYEEIRLTAIRQLAELSMNAELDRAAAHRKLAALNSENQELARTALTDDLTRLLNRKGFNEEIQDAIQNGKNSEQPVGLIMYDLDHFKRINDTYGHLFGDEVLKMVGAALKNVEDATHRVARYGGEEFAIICLNATRDELRGLAEEVRAATEQIRLQYGTRTVQVTASLGAALVDATVENSTANQLVEKADRFLLQAKSAGRNCVRAG